MKAPVIPIPPKQEVALLTAMYQGALPTDALPVTALSRDGQQIRQAIEQARAQGANGAITARTLEALAQPVNPEPKWPREPNRIKEAIAAVVKAPAITAAEAQAVRRRALATRAANEAVNAAGQLIQNPTPENAARLTTLSTKVADYLRPTANDAPVGLADVMGEYFENIKHPERRPQPVSMTLPTLDAAMDGGLFPGELMYLGGWPGTGKSTLAAQIALATAHTGQRVLVISLEMGRQKFMLRLLAHESGVALSHLRTRRLDKKELRQLNAARERLLGLPLEIIDHRMTVQQIREAATARPDLRLLVVDYLQKIQAPPSTEYSSRQLVEMVSGELVDLKRDLDLPTLVLSSLSRSYSKDQKKRQHPTMTNLRESGQLEHDADVVVLVDHDDPNDDEDDDVWIKVEKTRDSAGRRRAIIAGMDGPTMTITEASDGDVDLAS